MLTKILSAAMVFANFQLLSVAYAEQSRRVETSIQKVKILAGSYFFKPDQLTLKVNVPVELSVSKNSGFSPHTIMMDEKEAGMQFNHSLNSEPLKINFTPIRTGHFKFYCDQKILFFDSHRKKKMVGLIKVVD